MKIVFTATSPDINTTIDPRFGRAAYLLVVDTNTDQWEAHENPGVNAPGGAGIKAAQFVAKLNVQAALSGDFGPNAFDALQAAQIAMYVYGDCQTIPEALARFKANQLQQVGAPTRDDGHKHAGRAT